MRIPQSAAVLVGLALLFATPPHAHAQSFRPSIIAGIGVGSVWDDETFLGRGPTPVGGIAVPLGDHVSIEAEASVTAHARHIGTLSVDGTAVGGVARLAYAFRPADARVRPFASVGYGILHSAGELTNFVDRPFHWNLTEPAVEFGTGVGFKSGRRFEWRPELRWTSTLGTSSRPGVALPIWWPRLGVSLVLNTR
jgi:hypothetical protein